MPSASPYAWRANAIDRGGLKQPYEYDTYTGREIHDSPSITGLNKTPDKVLKNWILYGAHYTSEARPPYAPGRDPLTCAELADYETIDGTLLWVDGAIQTDLLDANRRRIVQRLKDVQVQDSAGTKACDVIRTYEQGPLTGSEGENGETEPYDPEYGDIKAGEWLIVDYKDGKIKAENRIYSEVVAGDAIKVILNGSGVYFEAQGTYWRLEEIERTMRQQQTGSNAKTYFMGIPRNVEESRAALHDGNYETFIPADVKISRAGSSPIISQLAEEFGILHGLYLAQMNITDLSSTPGRPVADDRLYQLSQMLREVEAHRDIMRQACALWGATIEFSEIHVLTVSDRQAEFDLLSAMLAAEVIEDSEFKQKAKRLI